MDHSGIIVRGGVAHHVTASYSMLIMQPRRYAEDEADAYERSAETATEEKQYQLAQAQELRRWARGRGELRPWPHKPWGAQKFLTVRDRIGFIDLTEENLDDYVGALMQVLGQFHWNFPISFLLIPGEQKFYVTKELDYIAKYACDFVHTEILGKRKFQTYRDAIKERYPSHE